MDRTSSSDAAIEGGTGSPSKRGISKARFEEIYSKGLIERGAHLTLRALAGEGRLAFSTAKKIGSVPRRNRAKRRAREAAKGLGPSNLDVIVSVSQKADGLLFETMKIELEDLFARMSTRWEDASESS